jgi:putative sigma-54 modulation protein
MKLQVTGKNLDVTQPIVDYAERKLTKLAKHLSDSSRVELELAVERNPSISQSQVAEATIWTKGPVLRARESSTDMYASIDLVADKLERQVKKYRARRQRGRPHGHARAPEPPPVDLPPTAAILTEEDEGELPPLEDEARDPGIVKTKRFNMKPMHPEEAALQLDLVGHDFFVFLSSETEEVAVIYRRRDGNFGVIEPVRG